jgi:hypothetical protein
MFLEEDILGGANQNSIGGTSANIFGLHTHSDDKISVTSTDLPNSIVNAGHNNGPHQN